jgi:hypothetical protein
VRLRPPCEQAIYLPLGFLQRERLGSCVRYKNSLRHKWQEWCCRTCAEVPAPAATESMDAISPILCPAHLCFSTGVASVANLAIGQSFHCPDKRGAGTKAFRRRYGSILAYDPCQTTAPNAYRGDPGSNLANAFRPTTECTSVAGDCSTARLGQTMGENLLSNGVRSQRPLACGKQAQGRCRSHVETTTQNATEHGTCAEIVKILSD